MQQQPDLLRLDQLLKRHDAGNVLQLRSNVPGRATDQSAEHAAVLRKPGMRAPVVLSGTIGDYGNEVEAGMGVHISWWLRDHRVMSACRTVFRGESGTP
jgi:hypothetical protein